MRFAYADPPYLGCGKRYYAKHHAQAADCDKPAWHAALIERLCREYPEGWALSASTKSLRVLLPMCPEDARVGAWVKPYTPFVAKVLPAYAWEPVIFCGGRKRTLASGVWVRDWVSASWKPGLGIIGAKPRDFCLWLFELLGAQPDDHLDDLFPGSGGVSAAWADFCGAKREADTPLFSGAAA